MSTVYHRPADPSGDDSYVRPLFADRCQAGFPSPATDYAEQELDLNSYCISRPAATFFLRASGESMNQAGVQNGDLLVVDRAEKPQHGDIVIAEIAYSALFDHGLASKSDQRFASIRSTGNLTFSTAF
ncbi:S24 family peptidase [Shigella sonnei]|uniref:S24 family peptidase n=1 Tax=Shigella sonnei TaxID=624 RepID=UPI000DA5E4F6|nr:DNA polymerase V subunit UmuD [Shigella sonnei]